MTAEIVNLRRARKNKLRSAAQAAAAGNRAAFGVPRAQKAATRAEAVQHDRTLDGARHDSPRD